MNPENLLNCWKDFRLNCFNNSALLKILIERRLFNMKPKVIATVILFAVNLVGYSQRQIHFVLKQDSQFELPDYRNQIDSALSIAEAVFNSDIFQNKIFQLSFKYSSYCKGKVSCTKNEKDRRVRIAGEEVLKDLFKEQNVQISVFVEKDGDALGATCPNEYAITMYYNNIMTDMNEDPMPPSYKLAVNLCHEYLHQVGYCHIYRKLMERDGNPDPRYINQDVTYTIGWEVYYILKAWHANNQKINFQ